MPTPVRIILTPEEFELGMKWGGIRVRESIKNGNKDKAEGRQADRLRYDIVGCCCEIAAAKALKVEWVPTVNTFKAPDVGGFQVRGTEWPNGKLVFRPGDYEDDTFILVTGCDLEYNVWGWMTGYELKQDKYWSVERNLWWAPNVDCHPMSEIWYVTRRHYDGVT